MSGGLDSGLKTSKIIVWAALAAVIIAAVVAVIVGVSGSKGSDGAKAAPEGTAVQASNLVRENSRVLSQAKDEKAVLVEFLDFECESCGAAYPFVEELRTKYGENVTFVQRYFPLPGHRNSMTSALAVEAAAQQDAHEAMYKKMFETQAQWGESADDKSAVFRGYAEDLGLDMTAFDEAVADPATKARVELDKADGAALGVTRTPTFFLDGQVVNFQTLEEFEAAVAATAAK
ncbi:protein-disulfide isomerase [Arthrobacter stackebrandtii]|uniref:Protein-disulfide isomerase n=1 Tax=Arthrobacter stackebrandtii TaxID=272161 RepID=A0ABS4YTF8_9MICC|nr:thioredoxin domain-containing protein [Arthrobacter stackebrandtii]MBP2411740.1 protein-disulfide isomerase [Arthrobacter stackebrandtii]PYG99627.1 disulfide bond formation protein DsbA [Arthrobacter stackebrandtii]